MKMRKFIFTILFLAVVSGCGKPGRNSTNPGEGVLKGLPSDGPSGPVESNEEELTLAVGLESGQDAFVDFLTLTRISTAPQGTFIAEKLIRAGKLDSVYIWSDVPASTLIVDGSHFQVRYRCGGKPRFEISATVSEIKLTDNDGKRTLEAKLSGFQNAFAMCGFFPVEVSLEFLTEDASQVGNTVFFEVRGI